MHDADLQGAQRYMTRVRDLLDTIAETQLL